jgi:DNA-binding transcriptional ArsR family regulator
LKNSLSGRVSPLCRLRNGPSGYQSPPCRLKNGSSAYQSPLLRLENGPSGWQSPSPGLENGSSGNESPGCQLKNDSSGHHSPSCRLKNGPSRSESPLARFKNVFSGWEPVSGQNGLVFGLSGPAEARNRSSGLSAETAAGKIGPMSKVPQSPLPVVQKPVLDADAVFFALAHPGRRRLLESLAQKRSCTAAEAGSGGGRLKRDSTSKQLQELVKAGLLTMAADAKDARRRRYTLHPGLTAAKNAAGQWEMDLGCCVMRWR